jgi:F-type H+-transporting ATPase subunit delta
MMSEDYKRSNIEKKIKLALCGPGASGWSALLTARDRAREEQAEKNQIATEHRHTDHAPSKSITDLQRFYQNRAMKVVEVLAQHGRVAFSSAFSSALDDRTICLNKVARPYAEALLGLAKSNDLLEEMTDDMRFLESLMKSNEFQTLLTNPSIAKSTRMEIVNSIFKPTPKKKTSTHSSTRSSETEQTEIRTLEAYSLNLILLLNHLDRTEILEDVVKEFINLSSREQRIVDVRLTSSGILLPENTHKIKDLLKGITGARKVNLLVEDDPSSFGGFKIEFGSAVIDLRLEHTLEVYCSKFRESGIRTSRPVEEVSTV